MADSSDEFESDLSCESEYESVESSDEWESESSSEEEEVDSDSEVVEGGKRGVPSGSVSSKSKRQKPATKAKRETKSKKTTASKYMDEEQLKELASWVFSAEQADLVEEHIRKQLPECPNIETVTERKDLVAHMLSGQQKQNFKLLIVGFCRKFSSLAMEYYTLAAKDRKARFSIAWMKVLRKHIFFAGNSKLKITRSVKTISQPKRERCSLLVMGSCHGVLSESALVNFFKS